MSCLRVAVSLSFGLAAFAQDSGKVNHGSSVLKNFTDRVAAYVKIQKAAQTDVQRLKPTNSAGGIKDYELRLADRIRQSRPDAVPGAIFTPEITQEFRRLIGITMHGAEAARIRESLRSAGAGWQTRAARESRVPFRFAAAVHAALAIIESAGPAQRGRVPGRRP